MNNMYLYQILDRVPGGQGDGFVFIFKLQFSPPRICHRSQRILSTDNANISTRGLLISIVKTITSTIHYFCKRRVQRGNTVIDSPDSTCVIGTRLLFDCLLTHLSVTYIFQIFPELNFKKNKASFHWQFSCQIPEVSFHRTRPIYQRIWKSNTYYSRCTTVLQCFPHFMSLFCWHTTYCNPRSNRFFYSPVSICQHFSSQKRKQ